MKWLKPFGGVQAAGRKRRAEGIKAAHLSIESRLLDFRARTKTNGGLRLINDAYAKLNYLVRLAKRQ